MITETTYFLKEINVEETCFEDPNISKEEISIIDTYIEITKFVQEINNLFKAFMFNRDNMISLYKFNVNDCLERTIENKFKQNDYILVNTLIINYISIGKSVTEAIENFGRYIFGKKSDRFIEFKNKCISKTYDEEFSYRFLYLLRNLSQHCHFIVSVDSGNRYSFNIDQILSTKNYDFNETMKEELTKIREEIYNKFNDHPRISVTTTIVKYHLSVIKIYLDSLEYVETIMEEYYNKINQIIKENPKLVHKSNNCLDGYVLYKMEDNRIHSFNSKDKFLDMFKRIKEEIKKIYKDESKYLEI